MGFNAALANMSEDDFKFVLKNGKRDSTLDGYDFRSLIYCSYKFLKETLPELIKIGNFEKLVQMMFIDRGVIMFPNDVGRIPNEDVLYFVLWVKDELELIAKMENEYLTSDTDPDLMAAGINELSVFGDMNMIDQLAGGDVLKYDMIKALPYNVIFDKQYKSVIEGRIEKRLIKIKSKPNKAGR